MKTIYLDIETIPVQDVNAILRIAETVKPPGTMKKAETIAAWEATDKPKAVEEAILKTSFNGAYGHVCCIGWAVDDEPVQSVIWPFDVDNEAAALYTFKSIVEKVNFPPTIVGHNVAEFDIRFLWQRAFVLGIRMPSWFPRDPKPWSREVFDTMTAFAGSRNTISMDALCAALGIAGKDGDMDGSKVADAWANGEYERTAAYCRDDVERTRKIHKRMMIALGEVA